MPRAAKIQLTAAQQEELERCVASRTLPVRAAERVKIILGLAAGKAKQQIAKQLDSPPPTFWWNSTTGSAARWSASICGIEARAKMKDGRVGLDFYDLLIECV
jgi:hypothetical protein